MTKVVEFASSPGNLSNFEPVALKYAGSTEECWLDLARCLLPPPRGLQRNWHLNIHPPKGGRSYNHTWLDAWKHCYNPPLYPAPRDSHYDIVLN